MKVFIIVAVLAASTKIALAQSPFGDYRCVGNNECKNERIVGQDDRPRPQVYQPQVTTQVAGRCNDTLPLSESYQANVGELTCGPSAVQRERAPQPVSDAVLDKWDVQRRDPVLRYDAEKTRYQDIKVEGTVNYDTQYSWTYQYNVGDFDNRCGQEDWYTMCAVDQYAISYHDEEGECDQWEQIEVAPSTDDSTSAPIVPNNSSGSSGYTYSAPKRGPVESPYRRQDIPEAPRGRGESRQELQQRRDDGWGSTRGSSSGSGVRKRRSALHKKGFHLIPEAYAETENGRCIHHRTNHVKDERFMGTINYSCHRTRAKWCTWFETKTDSRSCGSQQAKYVVDYSHDPKWTPDYKDANHAYRNYMDELPNKSDLLIGEREKLQITVNKSQSHYLQPDLKVEKKWNDYKETAAQPVECKLHNTPELHYYVWTVGRNKTKSPNPLAPATDENGNPMTTPLEFPQGLNGSVGTGRPDKIYLKDLGRETYITASEQSRSFADPDQFLKNKKQKNEFGKFWAVTDYRIQLFRKSRGYWVSVTPVDKFNSNSGDIVGDSVTISLNGGQGIPKFFTPDLGPFPDFFGRFTGRYGVEFTPGEAYYIKIQAIQKSYPFYESGCKDGSNACEGIAGEKVFSEPLMIKWVANPSVDTRSLYKKWRDFREHFKVY